LVFLFLTLGLSATRAFAQQTAADTPAQAHARPSVETSAAASDDAHATPGGVIVTLRDPYFAPDNYQLLEPGKERLAEVIDLLRRDSERRVLIEGHTDDGASQPRDQQLMFKRALAVRDYLLSHGVGAERVIARSFGSASPKVPNADAQARRFNRRVEIVVIEEGDAAADARTKSE
jgi:outer membrane protein OmpA-like peptidoglycan-associated protein